MVAERTGRSLPKFSDDDVVDYFAAEAVAIKAAAMEAEEQKKRERAEWRAGHKSMAQKPVAGRAGIIA